jgi:hypothetical protein
MMWMFADSGCGGLWLSPRVVTAEYEFSATKLYCVISEISGQENRGRL